jgi:methyl-accepting chemotaxis protein
MANYERLEFPKFRRPQSEEPLRRSTEADDDQMPAENLGDLLGRVSKNSTGEIDSLIGEFERLRGKLQTDSQRIQREVQEYSALSQQVMQLTKTISESVEKVRASVDRPTTERD